MKHASYFVALVAMGSLALLMVLSTPISMVMGTGENARNARELVNLMVAIAWAIVLVVVWVRYRGLAPKRAKPGRRALLVCAHLILLAGHGVVAAMFLVKDIGYLMILPVLVVIALYALGLVLAESARDRQGNAN